MMQDRPVLSMTSATIWYSEQIKGLNRIEDLPNLCHLHRSKMRQNFLSGDTIWKAVKEMLINMRSLRKGSSTWYNAQSECLNRINGNICRMSSTSIWFIYLFVFVIYQGRMQGEGACYMMMQYGIFSSIWGHKNEGLPTWYITKKKSN